MIRPFTILCFCAFAGAGAWLYQVKHQVATYDRELRDIRRQIEQARDRTTILRAEWALLNEPDRLRQVATRHLPLEPMQPQQFARLPEMERRLPTAVAFAGAPNLFTPPEPARGSAPVMLAAAQVPAPTTRAAPGPVAAPVAAPAPSRPAPEQRAQDPRAPESPAVQALAAAVAAQRASQTRPAPTMPPRPAPLRDVAPRPISPTLAQAAPPVPVRPAPAPIQQAAVQAPTREAPVREAQVREAPVRRASLPAPAAPSFVSALGGGTSLGRPMLAPPVPISSAVAATLDGRRDLSPPQSR